MTPNRKSSFDYSKSIWGESPAVTMKKPTKQKRAPKYIGVAWANVYSWGISTWCYSTKKHACESKDCEHYLRTVRVYVRQS